MANYARQAHRVQFGCLRICLFFEPRTLPQNVEIIGFLVRPPGFDLVAALAPLIATIRIEVFLAAAYAVAIDPPFALADLTAHPIGPVQFSRAVREGTHDPPGAVYTTSGVEQYLRGHLFELRADKLFGLPCDGRINCEQQGDEEENCTVYVSAPFQLIRGIQY